MGHKVGYPVGAWFQKRAVSAELDAEGNAINVMCDGGPENNGRVVPCDIAPKVFLGRPQPKWQGGFGATLTLLRDLRLFASLDFKQGFKKDLLNGLGRCEVRQVCPENAFPERYPAYIQAEFQDPQLFPTHTRIFDASFLKFREASATYTFPQEWASSFLKARAASIRLGVRNIYTWTKFPGLDPETHRMNQLHSRTEQDIVPQLFQFVTNIRLQY